MRRLLIVLIGFYMNQKLTQQIQLQMMINLIITLYIGNVMPFKVRQLNTIELFNEGCIIILTDLLIIFSDYCDNLDTKYNAGWGFIGLVLLNIGFNFGMIFVGQYRTYRMVTVRYFRLIKR